MNKDKFQRNCLAYKKRFKSSMATECNEVFLGDE